MASSDQADEAGKASHHGNVLDERRWKAGGVAILDGREPWKANHPLPRLLHGAESLSTTILVADRKKRNRNLSNFRVNRGRVAGDWPKCGPWTGSGRLPHVQDLYLYYGIDAIFGKRKNSKT